MPLNINESLFIFSLVRASSVFVPSVASRRAPHRILAAPDLSDVYSFHRGESLSDDQFFINSLTGRR